MNFRGLPAAPFSIHSDLRMTPPRLALVVALGLAGSGGAADLATVRQHQSFDFGWRFHAGDAAAAEQPGADDPGWRPVDLPHDWSIEGPYDEHAATGGSGGYLPTGVGWYRKTFTLPETDRGRRVALQFDGVYQHSTVWLNGHKIGGWPYGYASFVVDLTAALNFGATPNAIAVRVDNSRQPNSRWYSGSGIYRHTWLDITDPLHVAPWGVGVTTPEVAKDSATVRVQVTVKNLRATGQRGEVFTQVLDETGAPLRWQEGHHAQTARTAPVVARFAGAVPRAHAGPGGGRDGRPGRHAVRRPDHRL